MDIIIDALPNLLKGAQLTLFLTLASAIFGWLGGVFLGIARSSSLKPLHWATRIYIDFFRGTPLLVQIFMIYFGVAGLLKGWQLSFSFNKPTAAVLTLSLNSAAYTAEIVRGGIASIEAGQWDAAKSLGLSPTQTLRHIILPQAFRRMIPALGNEFITLLKNTSLVAVIGYQELFREGQLVVARTYRAFEIYFAVALVYLGLNSLAAQAFLWLEHRMDPLKSTGFNSNTPHSK